MEHRKCSGAPSMAQPHRDMGGKVNSSPASSCRCFALAFVLLFVIPQGFFCHPVGICFCFCCCLFSHLPPRQKSSRPKAAHFAAAVERSLYFAFALAVVCSF